MNKKSLRVLEFNKIKEELQTFCESSLGIDLVKDLLPYTNLYNIQAAQDETDEAYRLIIKRGNPPLFGIHTVSPDVKRAELGGSISTIGLIRIAEQLRVCRSLKAYLREEQTEDKAYKYIGEAIELLIVNKELENDITNAIIGENEISDNASTLLRSIRRQIRIKNDAIREKLNSIISSQNHKKYLQDTIITLREGRYVIPVKQENRASVPGLIHDISSSGATAFIEPMAVVELNNQLRELEMQEREEIERILYELSQRVANIAEQIKSNQILLQRLDFIFSKGKYALKLNATKPIFNTDGRINIKRARHPLLKGNVVPIDVYLGEEFTTLIVTGPNTGGKTVTLKTVGLFTLMGQAGLHLPCDFNSQLAVFEQVFADIGDEQSIEQSLSTFSSHMTNIVQIFKELKPNSLVLFDELGAGTDPTEGAALAMSILEDLKRRSIRTLATTHYSQLKLYALTTEGVQNASVEFDIDSLSPTYRLLIGVPGKSNAFEISKRLGLENYLIDYARELLTQENIEFEDALQAMERDRIQAQENMAESLKQKQVIEKLKLELEEEKNKTIASREKELLKAKEEAKAIIKKAKETSDLIIDELRSAKLAVEKEQERRIHEAKNMLSQELKNAQAQLGGGIKEVTAKKPPKNLQPGETVELLSLNQTGNVLTLPDDKGNVEVQVGIMKVTVDIKTLRRVESKNEIVLEKSKNKGKSMIKPIKQELDLRGKNVEESIIEIDKYLDDAFMAGLKEVFIIHGRGTGALREGVTKYLKGHRRVQTMRFGKYGEGGDGVTVVEIK